MHDNRRRQCDTDCCDTKTGKPCPMVMMVFSERVVRAPWTGTIITVIEAGWRRRPRLCNGLVCRPVPQSSGLSASPCLFARSVVLSRVCPCQRENRADQQRHYRIGDLRRPVRQIGVRVTGGKENSRCNNDRQTKREPGFGGKPNRAAKQKKF